MKPPCRVAKDPTANFLLICGAHRQTDNRLQISEGVLPGVTQPNTGWIKTKTTVKAFLLARPLFTLTKIQ